MFQTASPEAPTSLSAPLRSVLIGPRLRSIRERAGLRQSEIVRRMCATGPHVDEAQISRWECPTSTRYQAVPKGRLPQLAAALETTIEELAPEALAPDLVGFAESAAADDESSIELATDPVILSVGASWKPPAVQTYSSGAVVASMCAQPVPGRPMSSVDDDSVVVLRLRCPWCGMLNSSAPVPWRLAYSSDQLPLMCDQRDANGILIGCGRPMRARVSVSLGGTCG